jgi:hypothetical protein
MDLDDQELFFTQVKKKLYKDKELKEIRKQYAKKIAEDRAEIKDLLARINLIDKELEEVER